MAKARYGIINVPCRVTEDEYAAIKSLAAACKIKLVDFSRAALLEYKCESSGQSTNQPTTAQKGRK